MAVEDSDNYFITHFEQWCKENSIAESNLLFIPDPIFQRQEAIRRNSEFVTCDKCGVTGNRPNMMRWHFDNCKTKLRKCKLCGKNIPRQKIKDFLYNKKIYCNRSCYMKSKSGQPPIIMTQEVRLKISEKARQRWKKNNE